MSPYDDIAASSRTPFVLIFLLSVSATAELCGQEIGKGEVKDPRRANLANYGIQFGILIYFN